MTQEQAKEWIAQIQLQIDNNEKAPDLEWPAWFPKRPKKTHEQHMQDRVWLIGWLQRKFNIE